MDNGVNDAMDPHRREKDKFSHLTHATLYHLATGHAFIEAYTQCFHP
jgi:hypothetical protein